MSDGCDLNESLSFLEALQAFQILKVFCQVCLLKTGSQNAMMLHFEVQTTRKYLRSFVVILYRQIQNIETGFSESYEDGRFSMNENKNLKYWM